MLARSSMVLAIATGGIALGAVLGAAANPKMKLPPEQPWHGTLQAPAVSDTGYQLAGAGPIDLSPYRESYAPTWASEELVDWEPEYPAWTYSDWDSATGDDLGSPAADGPARSTDDEQAVEPFASDAAEQPAEQEPLPSEPHVAGNLAALY